MGCGGRKGFQDRDMYLSENTASELSPSVTVCSIHWYSAIDVSRKLMGFILRCQAVHEESTLPDITKEQISHSNCDENHNSGTFHHMQKEPNIL
jgi:hypothetical protein